MNSLQPADVRRRWFGSFFIIVAAGLLIWGQTVLGDYLQAHKIAFLFYWLTCIAFTFLALITALLDLFIIRRRTHKQHKSLFVQTFRENSGDPDLEK